MSTLPRPVFFVKYYDKGSTVMGADQMSAALAAQGVDARSVHVPEIASIRGAILVFIKTSRWLDLWKARRRGNTLLLDVQDTICFKRRIKNVHLFDGLIFKSRKALADFATDRSEPAVLYHQWDPRYSFHQAGLSQLKVAYLGHRRSLKRWNELPGITCIDEDALRAAGCYDDLFRAALPFNCHFSIREERREFLYKPNAKVSTAAACNVNLVTTPDEISVELLGEDYPYYTDVDPPSIARALEKARETLGGPVWQQGLARMAEVRERTRIERIARDYIDYFRRFC
ncbi:MAG TPA: hypothetical protein VMM92_16210 [Thermoanaerobaculia bacterium]|nr:hypothetical protein [Thermoanaerobaculia bacterium]